MDSTTTTTTGGRGSAFFHPIEPAGATMPPTPEDSLTESDQLQSFSRQESRWNHVNNRGLMKRSVSERGSSRRAISPRPKTASPGPDIRRRGAGHGDSKKTSMTTRFRQDDDASDCSDMSLSFVPEQLGRAGLDIESDGVKRRLHASFSAIDEQHRVDDFLQDNSMTKSSSSHVRPVMNQFRSMDNISNRSKTKRVPNRYFLEKASGLTYESSTETRQRRKQPTTFTDLLPRESSHSRLLVPHPFNPKQASRWKLCFIIQLAIGVPLLIFAFDAHTKKKQAHSKIELYEDEQEHILKQMDWLDKAAKRITESGGGSAKREYGSYTSANGMEELRSTIHQLRGEVRDMQWRIQQNARALIYEKYGDRRLKIFVNQPNDEKGDESQQMSPIIIELSEETPHATWILLDQIERGQWDHVQIRWISQITLQSDFAKGNIRERVEFIEKMKLEDSCDVSLLQDAQGALSLRINLADGPFVLDDDICIGKIMNESLMLPRSEDHFHVSLTIPN